MTDPQPARPLLRTMRRVRSVRSFRADPVPDEFLTEILEVARWTGSGSNRQPWTFVVVREPATLQAIAAASPNVRHVAGAAAAIVIVMDGGMPEIETFDEGRVTERILVAATALGLASAIGWIMPAGAAAVGALLGVPEGRRARTLVSLGYPTEEGARPKSAPGAAGDLSRRWCATSGSPEDCSASWTRRGLAVNPRWSARPGGELDGPARMTNMPSLPLPVVAFLESSPLAHVVTLDARGEPHVSMAWVGIEDGEVVIGTLSDQPKLRNLRRDPRIAMSFQAEGRDAYGLDHYLVLRGRARVTEGGAAALLHRLAHVYLGPDVDFPPMPNPPAGFVIRMTVEKVSGNGRWSDE